MTLNEITTAAAAVSATEATTVPTGRPSDYTPALGVAICERIAAGELLRTIVESDGMPTERSVYNWRVAYPDFNSAYVLAREHQAHAMYEKAVHLAETSRDWKRDKLRIDTLKWAAARFAPSRFADAPTPKLISAKDRPAKAAA